MEIIFCYNKVIPFGVERILKDTCLFLPLPPPFPHFPSNWQREVQNLISRSSHISVANGWFAWNKSDAVVQINIG